MLSTEEHEAMLAELMTKEVDEARFVEILDAFRADKSQYTVTNSEQESEISKLMKRNADLITANGNLHAQIGVQTYGADEEKEEEEKQVELSETITISDLEDDEGIE